MLVSCDSGEDHRKPNIAVSAVFRFRQALAVGKIEQQTPTNRMTAPELLSEITIRETRPSDLEEILFHRRQMFHDMGYTEEAVLDRLVRTSRKFVKRCLADGTYHGWFAIAADSRVVAGAGLLVTPWVAGPEAPEQAHRAYLLNVYTHPDFRKSGLARELTKKAIEWCRQHGFTLLWLHASDHGRPLYESLGFQPTNEMKLRIK